MDQAFWWAIVTLTTVGYGDKIPKTSSGRFIAGLSAVLGIIILSMPIVILGTNVSMNVRAMKEKENIRKTKKNIIKNMLEDKILI